MIVYLYDETEVKGKNYQKKAFQSHGACNLHEHLHFIQCFITLTVQLQAKSEDKLSCN